MYRILFAYPEVAPLITNRGIGTFVFEISRLLASSGQWEVDILTDCSSSPLISKTDFNEASELYNQFGIRLIDLNREDGVPTGWESKDITRSEQYYRHISRLHNYRHYHIIEFPDWRAPCFFVVRHKRTAGSFRDVQLVVHLHSSTKNVLEWQDGCFLSRNDLYCHYMEEYVKKYSDVVLSPTKYQLLPVHQTQNVFKKKLFRNGYPISSLYESILDNIDRGPGSGVITVACVGRLELRKGVDVLAHAIRFISESRSLDVEVQYVFCGEDRIGQGRNTWMSQTIQRILKGVKGWKILRPKSREDLANWLSSEVDICIVPSKVDNYPNVVMEAARAGCYVIASDAGGIPEIFEDYSITGALFPSKNYHALELEMRKAIQYIRNNPGVRIQIAQEFEESRQKQSKRTLAVYDEVVGKGEKHPAPSFIEKAKPRVSIIIPFYNSHKYAQDAIKSAFDSDYPNFEVILVNDGSDDPKSLNFLQYIENEFPNLRIIHKANGGLGDARNAGLKAASGELVVPLDADNMILPNMLSSCSRVLVERQNLAYVTTYFDWIREEDGARLPWQTSPISKPLGAIDPLLLLENTAGDALSMIRRSAIDSVGGYSTTIYCFEDWDLWLKFHKNGMEGDVLPEVHFIYRLHSDSMSRSLGAVAGIRLHQALLRQHQDLVRDQSFAIATLLLFEYWYRWRRPGVAWSPLIDIIRRAVNDPKLAFWYLVSKTKHRISKWVKNSPFLRVIVRSRN